MQTVKPQERKSAALFDRIRGAHEAELFGPRGRLPRRGEPDTSRQNALLGILAGLIVARIVFRLAVPRGIWLDEAITIHQARLSLHDLFANLYNGDRQPPLYHLVLWLTIRAFGHSEFAVRLPSLIAGTLIIPALYELGRELYDRRTGLIAAGFAAVSPHARLVRAGSPHVRVRDAVRTPGGADPAPRHPQPEQLRTGRATSSPRRRCCGRITSA